jgi:hypothetical protein
MIYNDIDTLAEELVRDIENVTDPLQDFNAIELAMLRLNQDRPNNTVEDISVTNSTIASLPSDWQPRFSALVRLEYPIASGCFLTAAALYQTPTGFVINLGSQVDGDVRVTYTTRHILHESDPELTTVPLELKEPLASYGAHLMLMQLASQYAHDTDSSIAIDSVDHGDKSRKFGALSAKYLKKYEDLVGIEKPTDKSAGDIINWQRPRLIGRVYR